MSPVAYPNLGWLNAHIKELQAELQQFNADHQAVIEADVKAELALQRLRDALGSTSKLPEALLAFLTVAPAPETPTQLPVDVGDTHEKLDQILKLLSEEDPSTPQALALLTAISDQVRALGDASPIAELLGLVQGQAQQLSDIRVLLLDNQQRDRDLDLFTDEMVERLHRGFTGVLVPLRNNRREVKPNPQWLVDNARFFLALFDRFKHTFPENGLVHLGSKAQSVRDLLRPTVVAQAATALEAGPTLPVQTDQQVGDEPQIRPIGHHQERGSDRSSDEELEDERPVRNGRRHHQEQPAVDDDLDGEVLWEEPDSATPERSEPPVLIKDATPDPTLADSPNGAALKSLLAQEGD